MTLEGFLIEVGQRVQNARRKANLRQVDVVEATSISYRHYQEIEAGRVNCRVETVFKLSQLFGVPPSDLLPGQSATELINDDSLLGAIEASKAEALKTMASGLAHEVNNPLGVISGEADLIGKYCAKYCSGRDSEFEEIKSSVQHIKVSVTKIAQVVENLHAFSHEPIEENEICVDLRKILANAIQFFEARMKRYKVKLIVEVPDKEIEYLVRPLQLEKALIHIIKNAFESARSHSEHKGEVKIRTLDDSTGIILFISDNGPEIPNPIREKIFEPFFTTKSVGDGQGLGLAAARGLIEYLGGKLSLSQDQDETLFTIHLPKKGS